VVQKQPEKQSDPVPQPQPAPTVTAKTSAAKPAPAKPEPAERGPLPVREVSAGDSARAPVENKNPAKPEAVAVGPKKPIDKAPQEAPSTERQAAGQFVTANAVLLRRPDGSKDRWQRVPKDSKVFTNEQLMSLPGYRSELKLDRGIELFLWGQVPEFIFFGQPTLESVATLHAPSAGNQLDVTLDRGRLLLANAGNDDAVKVRLRFRDQIWNLTLFQTAEVIIDLSAGYTGDIRFSKRPGGEEPISLLTLGVRKGRIALQIGFQPAIEMSAPYYSPYLGLDSSNWINAFARQPGLGIISWDNKGKAPSKPGHVMDVLPNWRFQLPSASPFREIVVEMQRALDDWAKQLTSRKDVDVSLALTEAYNEQRPAMQRIGAFGLGAIDMIGPLVDALDDDMRTILRASAARALQHWTARESGNDLALYQILLKKRYNEMQADTYMQLLHGPSETDVANPDFYQNLLSWLNSEKLGIRELALSYLHQLDPEGLALAKYSPLEDPETREAAIARWRKRIPVGKLPPKPTNPSKQPNGGKGSNPSK
jgi:hypothetical protein